MKKTKFNVQLFDNAPKCAQAVILEAAKSNGSDFPFSLNELAAFGSAYNHKTSDSFVETQFELIGDNKLHIDSLVNGIWENVAIIELVEVWETEQPSEDDLNGLFTSENEKEGVI